MLPWPFAIALTIFSTEQTMDHNDLADFKNRIGFSSLAAMGVSEGVRADWDELPTALSGIVKGKRTDMNRVNCSQSGLGTRSFAWKYKDRSIAIEVDVSGGGQEGARRALLSRASATMMMKIPYERRAAPLGDLAIQDPRSPSDTLMWVYRNVFVFVDNGETKVDVGPVAQAIQRFMEAHKVSRLTDHLPIVDQVRVSANEIHVGDEFQISIILGKHTPLDFVMTDFVETLDVKSLEDKLELVTRTSLTATFKAEKPGQTQIDIRVMDRKTLLSPPLSAPINVLPAR
jgi:hypothetical protein